MKLFFCERCGCVDGIKTRLQKRGSVAQNVARTAWNMSEQGENDCYAPINDLCFCQNDRNCDKSDHRV